MSTLGKNHLIDAISERCELPRDVVASVLDAQAVIAGRTLANGAAVILPGVGKLILKEPRLLTFKHPQTREEMTSHTRPGVAFRPAGSLKSQLDGYQP